MTSTAVSARGGRGVGRILGRLGAHTVMIIVTLSAILPFVWMLISSLKPFAELIDVHNPSILPQNPTLENYEEILLRVGFLQAMRNSILVAVPNTAAILFTSTVTGYVFSKYDFWGKEKLFTLILSTMMVPFAVLLIPLYITVSDLGLIDRLEGLVVTGLCSTFGIFLMRQSMEDIPNDYLDAARIDGAGEWWIYTRVIIPLSTAPIGALAVFTFLGQWDNFLWPSVLLTSSELQTLPLFLAGLRNLWVQRYDIWCAGAMLTVAPVMTIYTFAQKYFIRGLAMSGLKG